MVSQEDIQEEDIREDFQEEDIQEVDIQEDFQGLQAEGVSRLFLEPKVVGRPHFPVCLEEEAAPHPSPSHNHSRLLLRPRPRGRRHPPHSHNHSRLLGHRPPVEVEEALLQPRPASAGWASTAPSGTTRRDRWRRR